VLYTNHELLPTLESRRVLLRPLERSDIALLEPVALGQPELFRFMSALIRTSEELAHFVEQALADRVEQRSVPFVVIDKPSGAVAGSTRFGNLDLRHKRVEIGWTWLDARFHGTGLNKAMKFLMLRYAFEALELNRVEIKTNEQNTRSRRAIEAIGGQYEGRFRHHMVNGDGTLRNTIYYSILKEEWPELKQGVFAEQQGEL